MTAAPKKNPQLHQYKQRQKRILCRCQPEFKPNKETSSILRSYLKSFKKLFFYWNFLQTNGGRQLKNSKTYGSSHSVFLRFLHTTNCLLLTFSCLIHSTSTVKKRGKVEVNNKIFIIPFGGKERKICGNIQGMYVYIYTIGQEDKNFYTHLRKNKISCMHSSYIQYEDKNLHTQLKGKEEKGVEAFKERMYILYVK